MSNLRPIFQKYPFLIRPVALVALVIWPVLVTIQLWVNEWAWLKQDASLYWNLLIYKRETR